MRTDIINILFCLLLGMTLVSCSTIDDKAYDAEEPTEPVARPVDLLVNIGDKAMQPTKASSVSRRAATFQGMQGLVAIPFHTNGASVAVTDDPLIDLVGADETNNRVVNHNTYYVGSCHLMTGTDRMLVYGKSKPSSDYLSENGKLSNLPTIRSKTENITFSLTSVRNTSEAHADATALATYMTTIADTPGWSTTTDPTLKSYYMDFIRANAEGGGLMSGAAANIKAFVAALKVVLLERKTTASEDIKDIIDAIIDNIDAQTSIANNNYPRSFKQGTEEEKADSLPDGAAVIRWTKNAETGEGEFSVRTTTTTLDNINGITRYTYPAELVFFTDSPIRTSTTEVPKSTYEDAPSSKTWSAFLNDNYQGSQYVTTETKAVAVENPLQYGVANLQLKLTGMSATLMDAKNIEVTNADMEHLPLTGVIIGGQHTVGYNMKPQGEQTDVDGRFIYEKNIISGDSINTLVLQSYDNEKVPIILEFQNNTGNSFTGKDGVVYPGTRFYLIGMIDPKGQGTGVYAGRVFTQDHITRMSMNVASLAKAYTCMPDLLAPRLEIGVQVVTHWIQVTTTNVEL